MEAQAALLSEAPLVSSPPEEQSLCSLAVGSDKPLRAVLMVPLFLYLLCYLFPHASLPSPPATGLCCCVVVSSVSFCSNA